MNWQGVLSELVNAMLTNNVPKEIILVLIEVLPEECHRWIGMVDNVVTHGMEKKDSCGVIMNHVMV